MASGFKQQRLNENEQAGTTTTTTTSKLTTTTTTTTRNSLLLCTAATHPQLPGPVILTVERYILRQCARTETWIKQDRGVSNM